MKVNVAFSKPWLVVMIVIIVASTTSAATTVYASHQKSSSESSSSSTGSGSKGLDTSGSSSQDSSSNGGRSGSGPTPPSKSGTGKTPQSLGSIGSQTSGPNPPGFPPSTASQQQQQQLLPTCPNGEKPDSSGKCPPPSSNATPKGHTKDFGQGFGKGAEDGKVGVYDPAAACAGASNSAHCIQGYNDSYVAACTHGKFGCGDGPTTCIQGEKCVIPSGLTNKTNPNPTPRPTPAPCPSIIPGTCLPPNCHQVDKNGTRFVCKVFRVVHNTITHNTIEQVGPNDINLMLVTTCTADFNNHILNGNLAALCDSTIILMHDDGLNAQLPQVDMYLKARGLLQ